MDPLNTADHVTDPKKSSELVLEIPWIVNNVDLEYKQS